jgi:hypothetical protein
MQGCQIVYLYTKNGNFNAYLEASGWKNLVYFMAIWYILGILIYCMYSHLVFLWPFRYIYPILACFTKKNLAALMYIMHMYIIDEQ